MDQPAHFDAIIIGGSYAGLAAGMALGRAQRRVLIVDGGMPCNRQTPRSHNFITHDGTPPLEITGLAREQVARYPTVEFQSGLVTNAARPGSRVSWALWRSVCRTKWPRCRDWSHAATRPLSTPI